MAVHKVLQEMIENWSQIISDKEACEIARRVWSECHKVLKNDAKEIEIKVSEWTVRMFFKENWFKCKRKETRTST